MATEVPSVVPPAAPELPDFKESEPAGIDGEVEETQVEKIIYWRDVMKSGIIFGIGNAVCILTLFMGYSFLSVSAFCLLFFLVFMFIYKNFAKSLEGHLGKEKIPAPEDYIPTEPFSAEAINAKVPEVVDFLNETASSARDIMLCKDNTKTLKAIAAVFGLYIVGRIFPDLVLFYVIFLIAFILPKVYEMNKEEIDKKAAEVQAKISEESQKALKIANEKTQVMREQAAKKISESATPLMEKMQPQLDSIRQRISKANATTPAAAVPPTTAEGLKKE